MWRMHANSLLTIVPFTVARRDSAYCLIFREVICVVTVSGAVEKSKKKRGRGRNHWTQQDLVRLGTPYAI